MPASTASKANGASSSRSPNARRSRHSNGWPRGIATSAGATVSCRSIVVGRFADGKTAFILPLAVETQYSPRRLCWLGQELSTITRRYWRGIFRSAWSPTRFLDLWREFGSPLQSDPELRYDWIELEKMPQTVGVQANPFINLGVVPNANSAHITQLGPDWKSFYRDRRSSATRRRDRTKRKRMEAFGEIRFETAAEPDDLRRTLDTLWAQKKRTFAHKGIADIFARPGYREFFADFASNANSRHMAHVSRIEIGATCAAANFAIVYGDCYYHVLSSYCDDELTRYGPGTLHLRELLAYAINRGLRLFDFTIGDEQYKLEWSDLRVKLYDYSAAATWRGWPTSLLSIARRHAKRTIKQTPLLWRLVSRLRSAFGPLLHRESFRAATRRRRPQSRATRAAGAGLRHGRHGPAAADRGGRHCLQRRGATGRPIALIRALRNRGSIGMPRRIRNGASKHCCGSA